MRIQGTAPRMEIDSRIYFHLADSVYIPSFFSRSTIVSSVGGPSNSFSVSLLLQALRTQVKDRWSDLNKLGSLVMSVRERTVEGVFRCNRHCVGTV